MGKTVSIVAALALVVFAACGDERPTPERSGDAGGGFDAPVPSDAEAYPVVASSEHVVGENRFLVGVLNDEDAPIGSPGIDVAAEFFFIEESTSEAVTSADFEFVRTLPGQRGLYVGYVTFDRAGKWGAEVSITGEGIDEAIRTNTFDVVEEGTTPAVGEQAPASKTPTARDVNDLSRITTDPHPDRDFYRMSIAQALRAREPFVVVFATPKFCTSAVCGPTLDIVKDVARGFRDLTFIHVEVYTNLDDPSNLKVVPSVEQWGLPTEPWVFVVDERGRVAAKYEGTVARSELQAALNRF